MSGVAAGRLGHSPPTQLTPDDAPQSRDVRDLFRLAPNNTLLVAGKRLTPAPAAG